MLKKSISELNMNACSALWRLNCSQNQLATLDVSGCLNLYELYCSNNQLASLDVSNNTNLLWLYCAENLFDTLDVSGLDSLTNLDCSDNQLTVLDISNNILLNGVYCSRNQLATLDTSNNSVLWELVCAENQLATLDLSTNSALYLLECANNPITHIKAILDGGNVTLNTVGNGYTAIYFDYTDFYVEANPISPSSFINWTSAGTQVSTNTKCNLTKGDDYDLTANFQYSVGFDNNGGDTQASPEGLQVNPSDPIAAIPTPPTREGYDFMGWYKQAECTSMWDFDTETVTKNITLYAKWLLSLRLQTSPADCTILKNEAITVTPNITGGDWSYPNDLFSGEISDDKIVLVGLKDGTGRVTYTVGKQSVYVDILIDNQRMIENPQTGDYNSQSNMLMWVLFGLVLILGTGIGYRKLQRVKTK